MNLEKRAMDNNDQIHFKRNCQKKRELPLLFPVPCIELWKLIASNFLEESFYFYKGHGMRRGKSKNSKHTATVKSLQMINHKSMRTISFASCLLRKARKDSSAYSQKFLHAISKDKARQDLSEMSFFFPSNQYSWKRSSLPLRSAKQISQVAFSSMTVASVADRGEMKVPDSPLHFELCTWGASCIVKVYALVSLAQAGEERTAFSILVPAEV